MRTGSVLSVESCEKSTVKKEQASRKATLALIDDVWQLLGFMVLNLSHKRLLAGCHAAVFFPSARAAIGHAQANWPQQQVRPSASGTARGWRDRAGPPHGAKTPPTTSTPGHLPTNPAIARPVAQHRQRSRRVRSRRPDRLAVIRQENER